MISLHGWVIFELGYGVGTSLVAQRVNCSCNAGDLGLIPRMGRSPGEKNGNPLQYFCLENATDGESGRLQSMEWQGVGTMVAEIRKPSSVINHPQEKEMAKAKW